VPQTALGSADSENAMSPLVPLIDTGGNVWSVGWPSMLRPLMYLRPFDAPRAGIVMDFPAGSLISVRSNSGVFHARIDAPGATGKDQWPPRHTSTREIWLYRVGRSAVGWFWVPPAVIGRCRPTVLGVVGCWGCGIRRRCGRCV
jgi:hypothetical protein